MEAMRPLLICFLVFPVVSALLVVTNEQRRTGKDEVSAAGSIDYHPQNQSHQQVNGNYNNNNNNHDFQDGPRSEGISRKKRRRTRVMRETNDKNIQPRNRRTNPRMKPVTEIPDLGGMIDIDDRNRLGTNRRLEEVIGEVQVVKMRERAKLKQLKQDRLQLEKSLKDAETNAAKEKEKRKQDEVVEKQLMKKVEEEKLKLEDESKKRKAAEKDLTADRKKLQSVESALDDILQNKDEKEDRALATSAMAEETDPMGPDGNFGCDSGPCHNGGQCVTTLPVGYQCMCPDNFHGDDCEIPLEHPKLSMFDDTVSIEEDGQEVIVKAPMAVMIVLTVIQGVAFFTCTCHYCLTSRRMKGVRKKFERRLRRGERLTTLPPTFASVGCEICKDYFLCCCLPCMKSHDDELEDDSRNNSNPKPHPPSNLRKPSLQEEKNRSVIWTEPAESWAFIEPQGSIPPIDPRRMSTTNGHQYASQLKRDSATHSQDRHQGQSIHVSNHGSHVGQPSQAINHGGPSQLESHDPAIPPDASHFSSRRTSVAERMALFQAPYLPGQVEDRVTSTRHALMRSVRRIGAMRNNSAISGSREPFHAANLTRAKKTTTGSKRVTKEPNSSRKASSRSATQRNNHSGHSKSKRRNSSKRTKSGYSQVPQNEDDTEEEDDAVATKDGHAYQYEDDQNEAWRSEVDQSVDDRSQCHILSEDVRRQTQIIREGLADRRYHIQRYEDTEDDYDVTDYNRDVSRVRHSANEISKHESADEQMYPSHLGPPPRYPAPSIPGYKK